MTNTTKTIFKVIGLIVLLIILFFVVILIFLGVFGTGGQAESELNGGLGGLLLYILPAIIVYLVAYKLFKKQKDI